MDKIRTLNLRNRIVDSYGQTLNIPFGTDALMQYQELLMELLESIQRKNDAVLLDLADSQRLLAENQILINTEFKYKNCLKVVR